MTFDPTKREPAVPPTPAATPPAPVIPGPVTTAPIGAAPTAKGSSSGRWLNVILAGALLFAVGGIAFAIGRTTAPATTVAGNGRFGNGVFPIGSGAPAFGNGGQGGQGGGFIGRGNGLTITGTVASISGDTMTITTANGQTIDVTLGSDTTYSSKTPASASAVTSGSTVEVQIDPASGFGGLGRGGAAPSGSTPTVTAAGVTVDP